MKYRSAILSACVMLLAVMAVRAADVNGKWVAQIPGRDGQTRETTFNFKVDGDKLTGSVSGRQGDNPISDGKVSGDEISITVNFSMGGNQGKLLYKGQI